MYPSGCAFATSSFAMLPFAPARFSTTTGWPSVWPSLSASTRAAMSGAPPGGIGTMIVTGRDGELRPGERCREEAGEEEPMPDASCARSLAPRSEGKVAGAIGLEPNDKGADGVKEVAALRRYASQKPRKPCQP